MQVDLKLDRTILSYALKSKHFAMEVSNNISFDYFHTDVQWLYKAITEHFNNPKFKEIPTANIIREYLGKNHSQKDLIENGMKLFDEVYKIETDPAEFSWYIEKLKDRYNHKVQRDCAHSVVKLIKGNDSDRVDKINDVLRKSVMTIDSIHKKESYEEGSLSNSAKSRALKYKEVEANPEVARGILTGFAELDRISNGNHAGELMLIGGSTGTGKSVLMHNMAVNAYLGGLNPLEDVPAGDIITGKNILYFSLEMPKASQERRIDACMAGVIANEIRDGRLSQEDKEKFLKVLKFQASYNREFHIIDMPRNVTAREIEVKYVEACDKYGIKFDQVYIDYLGLMKPNHVEAQDWLELGYVSAEVHEFARAYKISTVSAVQLNAPKDPNKPSHSTDRIARSKMIPTNANVILQIANRGDDEHTKIDMPVYITKMRDGEKGSFILMKDFARMKVIDMTEELFADGDYDDDI
jgi:replicative DNA helicase